MSQRIEEHAYIQVLDDVCFWDDDDNLIWEIKKGTSIVAIVSTKGNCQTVCITKTDQHGDAYVAERHQTLDNQKEFRVLRTLPGFFELETMYTQKEYIEAFEKEAQLLAERINTYRHDPMEVFSDWLDEHGQRIETRRAA